MDGHISGWNEFSQACHSLIDKVIVSVTLIGNITYLFWHTHTSHISKTANCSYTDSNKNISTVYISEYYSFLCLMNETSWWICFIDLRNGQDNVNDDSNKQSFHQISNICQNSWNIFIWTLHQLQILWLKWSYLLFTRLFINIIHLLIFADNEVVKVKVEKVNSQKS